MKKLLVVCGVVLAFVVVLAGTLAFATRSSQGEEETTQDIGARWDQDVQVMPATFRPALSADAAIARATQELKEGDHWDAVALKLPVRSTVATFTGKPVGPRPAVKDLKVRIVVFENVPLHRYCCPGDSRPYTPGRSTASIVLDDATGEFIYGALIGSID